MPRYRRAEQPGGTFFLTLVTLGRRPSFMDVIARACLHNALVAARQRRSFELLQSVLLPDHLHLII